MSDCGHDTRTLEYFTELSPYAKHFTIIGLQGTGAACPCYCLTPINDRQSPKIHYNSDKHHTHQ